MVRISDEENLALVGSAPGEVLLGEFYRRFPWPWPPMRWEAPEDPTFELQMLNQSLGDWSGRSVPRGARIWVGGCGTNQALHTALKFPDAQVLGSDVSSASLELCRRHADQLGVTNLELREETLNEARYREEFDYVICTGVIHHNEQPRLTLERLARAMKPDGVLELMVYNRFHRTLSSCFQKAVRLLGTGQRDFDRDLATARQLVEQFPAKNQMGEFLTEFREGSESDFADLLIHPLEHSYTVSSLRELAITCGLDYVLPCVTAYGRFCSPSILWVMHFAEPALQARYDALDDADRWQVTNLLLYDRSPLLWFYLRRRDTATPRRSERDICDELLRRPVSRSQTRRRVYLRDEDGIYRLSTRALPHPVTPPDLFARRLLDAVEPGCTLADLFRRLDIPATLPTVHEARVKLTTSEFPFLNVLAEA